MCCTALHARRYEHLTKMREAMAAQMEALQALPPAERQARVAAMYRRMVEASLGTGGCGHTHHAPGEACGGSGGGVGAAEAAAPVIQVTAPAMSDEMSR